MDDANRALIASEGDKADALSNLYIQSINNLIEDLQKINSKYYDKEEPTFSDWKRMGLDSESFNLINKQMGVFGGGLKQASVDQFARDITNFWKESYLRTAYVIDSAVPPNVDIGFQMPPDVFLYDYLNTPMKGKAFSEELGFISDEMAYHIHGQLVLSMWSGDSTAEMAKRIRDYVGIDEDQKLVTRPRASAQIYRANTIARTEMARAGNMAANYLFDQNQDILEDKVWTAKWSGIGVCDECLMRDGLTPDEIDELGDDLDTEPPGHPNCRCRWAPKVKDWNDILGDLGNGMKSDIELPDGPVKPAPYEDWANDYVSPSGFVQIHAEVS
ncbi:MAG: hypothetical protein KGL39_42890 [Patescibacteria group bacterium]|nr:hypothetical protein [Patescibacteria group bacterium]